MAENCRVAISPPQRRLLGPRLATLSGGGMWIVGLSECFQCRWAKAMGLWRDRQQRRGCLCSTDGVSDDSTCCFAHEFGPGSASPALVGRQRRRGCSHASDNGYHAEGRFSTAVGSVFPQPHGALHVNSINGTFDSNGRLGRFPFTCHGQQRGRPSGRHPSIPEVCLHDAAETGRADIRDPIFRRFHELCAPEHDGLEGAGHRHSDGRWSHACGASDNARSRPCEDWLSFFSQWPGSPPTQPTALALPPGFAAPTPAAPTAACSDRPGDGRLAGAVHAAPRPAKSQPWPVCWYGRLRCRGCSAPHATCSAFGAAAASIRPPGPHQFPAPPAWWRRWCP
mmetsp:Transcript_19498/g.48769  ORF Transcript_19498/g.48769 Transcript_19498/m.48769 type:complete len:338 (+) Transcript_19498:716-1729(+)